MQSVYTVRSPQERPNNTRGHKSQLSESFGYIPGEPPTTMPWALPLVTNRLPFLVSHHLHQKNLLQWTHWLQNHTESVAGKADMYHTFSAHVGRRAQRKLDGKKCVRKAWSNITALAQELCNCWRVTWLELCTNTAGCIAFHQKLWRMNLSYSKRNITDLVPKSGRMACSPTPMNLWSCPALCGSMHAYINIYIYIHILYSKIQ